MNNRVYELLTIKNIGEQLKLIGQLVGTYTSYFVVDYELTHSRETVCDKLVQWIWGMFNGPYDLDIEVDIQKYNRIWIELVFRNCTHGQFHSDIQ